MLPIILGLIGGGFLVSAFTEDKKYAKGGSIPNNYKGKTAEEVWDEWTVDQRDHFLKDHNLYNTKADPTMTSKELKEYDGKAVEWGSDLKNKLEIHIEEGQYAKGGMMSKGGGIDYKTYLHINKKNDSDVFPLIDDGYYVKLSKHKEVFLGGQIFKSGMTKTEAIDFAKDLMIRWNIPNENLIIDEEWIVGQMADGGMMAKGGKINKTKKETMTKKATVAKKNPQTNKFKQVMAHAKSTRKQGEAWTAAVSRAWKEMGK